MRTHELLHRYRRALSALLLLIAAGAAAAQDAPLPKPGDDGKQPKVGAKTADGKSINDLAREVKAVPLRAEFLPNNSIRKPNGMIVRYYRADAVSPELLKSELDRWKSDKGSIEVVGPGFPIRTGDGKKFVMIQNTLRIEEHEDRWPDLEGVLAIIDAPQPQVYIEAKIVEVTFDDDMRVGMGPSNIRVDRHAGDLFFKRADFVFSNILGATDNASVTFGSDDKYVKFDYILQLGKSGAESRIMSQPGIIVTQGEVASIKVGDQEPIVKQNLSGTNVTATTEFKDVGLLLEVEPLMIGRRRVRARVNPRISRVSDFRITATSNNRDVVNPVISEREAVTVVDVLDGDTVVISGLDQEAQLDERKGIPFLMDIPVAGYLFGSTTKRTVKTELVFFVTISIVRPGEAKVVVPPVERERAE
jgi:type II secretory pathway component GspD/PulD (secretin)